MTYSLRRRFGSAGRRGYSVPQRACLAEGVCDGPAYFVPYRESGRPLYLFFYREAWPKDAPTILLLHGFPSSLRMFEPLLARLAGRFHMVAPDYMGFGHSDAPTPKEFSYTFDNIAKVMDHFKRPRSGG